jgi:hypothetical protein
LAIGTGRIRSKPERINQSPREGAGKEKTKCIDVKTIPPVVVALKVVSIFLD